MEGCFSFLYVHGESWHLPIPNPVASCGSFTRTLNWYSTRSPPPLTEQHRIIAEVERRLSVADEMEKTIEQSLKQAERLRQSILKRAFAGKLVPQDPEDERAGVLLERIKEEKAQREKVKVKVKRKVKRTME